MIPKKKRECEWRKQQQNTKVRGPTKVISDLAATRKKNRKLVAEKVKMLPDFPEKTCKCLGISRLQISLKVGITQG